MKIFFSILALVVIGICVLFFYVTSHLVLPHYWSTEKQLEYKWYHFREKLGFSLPNNQLVKYRKLINEHLKLAWELSFEKEGKDWIGFYYPDKSNLIPYTITDGYYSLESCRATLRRDMTGKSTYECGYKCKMASSYKKTKLWICDRTTM